MRTTLNIDDDLYRRAKAAAALQGVPVTAFVESCLRAALSAGAHDRPIADMPVSTRGGGLAPSFASSGLDLDDMSAVWEYLDDPSA